MQTTITVNVTENDINKGIRGNCSECPTALALLRVPDVVEVWADEDYLSLRYKNGIIYHYQTPKVVSNFIERFDNFEKVVPFSFELNDDFEDYEDFDDDYDEDDEDDESEYEDND